jgi:hypothetical protein
MTLLSSEKPGGQTPWASINQLLAPDERFEVHSSHGKGYLLAPKQTSQVVALLYLLHQASLPFCVQGRGTCFKPHSPELLIVSMRAFSQVIFHPQGVCEVGAGCSISHLHHVLAEHEQEVSLEAHPLTSAKRSVGGVFLSGKTGGLQLKQESAVEALLGAEWVSWEGSQMKGGSCLRSAVAGPAWHKLLWGIKTPPGIVVKFFFKTYPFPAARLRLSWSFRQMDALWQHFHVLRQFCSSWERLDCILSGRPEEQGFILAQLSGLPEEIHAFQQHCPHYQKARQQEVSDHVKDFLSQQQLNIYSGSLHQHLVPGEYLWYQGLTQCAWWLTTQVAENENRREAPLWKQRFCGDLKESHG